MNELRDRYKRFKENYRTQLGGIRLYPQFDDDLEYLMMFLEQQLDQSEGYVDCSWRRAE